MRHGIGIGGGNEWICNAKQQDRSVRSITPCRCRKWFCAMYGNGCMLLRPCARAMGNWVNETGVDEENTVTV